MAKFEIIWATKETMITIGYNLENKGKIRDDEPILLEISK